QKPQVKIHASDPGPRILPKGACSAAIWIGSERQRRLMRDEAGIHRIPLPAAPIAVSAFCHGRPKPRQWRSPVPQSEEKLFPSVNYLTLLDRFLELFCRVDGLRRPSEKCRFIGGAYDAPSNRAETAETVTYVAVQSLHFYAPATHRAGRCRHLMCLRSLCYGA